MPAELRAYLEKEMRPAFAELDFESRLVESPSGKSPFLIAEYREGASLPTVLVYGHGDVVDGMEGEWRGDLDPFKTTKIGNRVYGRGTADNKGQHSINLAALRAVRDARGGKLGFNAKFLVEMGEEIGSPDLNKVCASLRDELKADLLLASDGPRLAADRPTIFLGCRGGIRIHLDVNLREGGHHSGNWGGVLANPATILANAIASLVDERGRMKLDALKPPRLTNQIRSYLADVEIKPTAGRAGAVGELGRGGTVGGRTALCLEHAGSAGDVVGQYRQARRTPFPAMRARCCSFASWSAPSIEQVVDAVRAHLHASGFPMVEVSATQSFIASRTDFDSPWIKWAADSIRQTTGKAPAVLPNFGGSLPNDVFSETLGTADDLGAAFLSRLLPARARRAHPARCHRGGARHHGGAVLGSRREENLMGNPEKIVTDEMIRTFSALPAWLEATPALISRGRFLDCDCRLGPIEQPFFVSIRGGRIVEFTAAPVLMRSWRFSYRATPSAWTEYWKPMPTPGWHDLFALTKRGEAVLEGDLHPFWRTCNTSRTCWHCRGGISRRWRHERPDRTDGRPLRPCRDRRRDAPHLFRGERRGHPAGLPAHAGSDGRQLRHLLADAEITKRFRVIAFDMPWHGKSMPPDGWDGDEYRLTTARYTPTSARSARPWSSTGPS